MALFGKHEDCPEELVEILRAGLTLLNCIDTKLTTIEHRSNKIMAAIDDLNAEVTALTTSISAEIAAATVAITAAIQNGDSTAIEAAVGNLQTLQKQVDDFTASLAPTVPPPTGSL